MGRLFPRIRLRPTQGIVLSFLLAILGGTLLLMLPLASASGQPLSPLGALFMATSAVCVTGLAVVDTGSFFSPLGQVIVLLLIQLGGLGYMAISTGITLFIGGRLMVRHRVILQEALGSLIPSGIVGLVRTLLFFTLLAEGVGTVLLFGLFLRYPEIDGPTAWVFALFHSVSAFCNAGLDLFGSRFPPTTSLAPFIQDGPILLILSGLIILGGGGFCVVADLATCRRLRRASLHTKVVLSATAVLLLGGTVALLLLEFGNPATLGPLSLPYKLGNAWFLSVTARTAGFSTFSMADLHPSSQFLILFLMFIGASPGGTGGGIKTTTLVVVLLAVWASIRGNEDVMIFERTISRSAISRALGVFALSTATVFALTMLLNVTESGHLGRAEGLNTPFLALQFEAISAFGTVGLSSGITPDLTPWSQLLLILGMFVGRLGPLTLAVALAERTHRKTYRYPEERILIG